METTYICGFCGAAYNDITEYMQCVCSCHDKFKKKEEAEKEKKRIEEINTYIKKIKNMRRDLNSLELDFYKKYSEEYELNFGTKKPEIKEETVKKDHGVKVKVNGKEVKLNELNDTQELGYLADLLSGLFWKE